MVTTLSARTPSGRPKTRYWELGKRLGEVFAAAGEGQSDTADRLEISQSYVSRIVTGKDRPGTPLLGKINRLYEINDLDGLLRLGRYFEADDPEADGAVLAMQQTAELAVERALTRLGILPSVPVAPETYYGAYQRLYHEMAARLRADGYETVPAPTSHEGGSAGLTPEDAEQEIAELERVFRKRFPLGKG